MRLPSSHRTRRTHGGTDGSRAVQKGCGHGSGRRADRHRGEAGRPARRAVRTERARLQVHPEPRQRAGQGPDRVRQGLDGLGIIGRSVRGGHQLLEHQPRQADRSDLGNAVEYQGPRAAREAARQAD